jgi:cytochrome c biogenesis protein CcdA
MGGHALIEQVTFTSPTGRVIRLGVGILLIVLGLIQLGRIRFPFHRAADLIRPLLQSQASIRRQSPAAGFALFGFIYLVAGFG